MNTYDLLITGAEVVRPGEDAPRKLDVAVTDGRFAAVEERIDPSEAATVVDASGRHLFPGVVDAHQHWGIYNPLPEDATSESRAAAQGGVTTGLTYIRTGAYYLNRTGPYREIFPDVLAAAEGRAYVDYGFHVAPILSEHIDEIPALISEFGVPSFKIFMFYGAHGLHGRSSDQGKFLMIPEDHSYDLAHFEFVMRGIQAARESADPADRDHISLSLHCETAEIMRAYTRLVEQEGRLKGLEAYSAARPPHSEGLAITIASYLAHETELPNINLLHLTSRKAIEAAMMMQSTFPHIDFRREVTVGHLLADFHTAANLGGKVNPPLRSREDVESLWEHLLAGHFDWVVSDHACCRDETKFGDPRDDVFLAKSGFGGAEYLLPGMVSEGRRRGLSYNRIAELVSTNPARRYGLATKGAIDVGYDADFCLLDDRADWVVRAEDSQSTQEYTPFEGFHMTARVADTYVRGHQVLADGAIVGDPVGRFIHRSGANASRP